MKAKTHLITMDCGLGMNLEKKTPVCTGLVQRQTSKKYPLTP